MTKFFVLTTTSLGDALQEAGALPAPEADGRRSTPQRFAGRQVRVYPIHADKLGAGHGA